MLSTASPPYDAILLLSFGGPEKPEEVIPFLENVLRGRNVPRERMLEVAEHYYHFGGVSPINQQNRELLAALRSELSAHGPDLPLYWGNRNWHPLLADTFREMKAGGIRHALAFVTSAFSSYSGCRQYREDVQKAQAAVGEDAPAVSKLRVFYNHPGFIEPMVDRVGAAFSRVPPDRQSAARLVFTAHSVPLSMARTSQYEEQLREACRLVAERLGRADYVLVYQSRSGPPQQPWLEPDIQDHLRDLRGQGVEDAVVAPIGFISDHLEVLYDLDTEAQAAADSTGLSMYRAATVGTDPRFVSMIRELIQERIALQRGQTPARRALGSRGPNHDVCPADCCPAPARSTGPPSAGAPERIG
jgi:protoporphyrin/coproporphyrin ferrochelatase